VLPKRGDIGNPSTHSPILQGGAGDEKVPIVGEPTGGVPMARGATLIPGVLPILPELRFRVVVEKASGRGRLNREWTLMDGNKIKKKNISRRGHRGTERKRQRTRK